MGDQVSPADTSFQGIFLWVNGLSALLSFAVALWMIFSGPSRKNASQLEIHGKRLDDHNLRINGMEQAQRALPNSKDMHELELAMEQLKGELKTMSAVMSGQSAIMERLEAIVSRHENHLLKG